MQNKNWVKKLHQFLLKWMNYSKKKGSKLSSFHPHSLTAKEIVEKLSSTEDGLSKKEVRKRLKKFGENKLFQKEKTSLIKVFFHQFLSAFIYILLIAAIIAIILEHWQDAFFIMAVLLVNAVVGSIQEYAAEKSAEALQKMIKTKAIVIRNGQRQEIDSKFLVPGDILILKSGKKIPADIRLISSKKLKIDESLLTGESESVEKNAEGTCEKKTPIGDRTNMVFAGTTVTKGEGKGIVTATGDNTEVGHLSEILHKEKKTSTPPLLIRMKKFTFQIAIGVICAICVIFVIEFFRGTPWQEILILSIALVVSTVPEGLPIAITVALSMGARRMAKRHVIIRKLVAVEALGSCTCIATDKTGTLTINKLTAKTIAFPDREPSEVTGEGLNPTGKVQISEGTEDLLRRLLTVATLCNEAEFQKVKNQWEYKGDMVDVALLVLAAKEGYEKRKLEESYQTLAEIPYESKEKYAATLNQIKGERYILVKGATERILPFCSKQATPNKDVKIDEKILTEQGERLAGEGYRVLAFAERKVSSESEEALKEDNLKDLTFLGFVGMIDPIRPGVKKAVKECREAGIEVVMITGDHPQTALAIARELHFANIEEFITGKEIRELSEKNSQINYKNTKVFARVEPKQKVDIVHSLKNAGHFVAVTGDGANDAPALGAANVGVAMGKRGTEVARESSEIILSDDNFASIVHGIEEGRIAYRNVRKVIFLLLSTGAAEVILFTLSLITNLPLPLGATQLLWLNMVTNGIQDVALGLEPKEGDEMKEPPRGPREDIFNWVMIQRVVLTGLYMGVFAFIVFITLLSGGLSVDESRNYLLLLMVLFENVHAFNSRSEKFSAFLHNPLKNPILIIGILLAQLIHITAMYTPWFKQVLKIRPVPFYHWLGLLGMASTLMLVMESEKWIRKMIGARAKKR